jgi:hypothetical protein
VRSVFSGKKGFPIGTSTARKVFGLSKERGKPVTATKFVVRFTADVFLCASVVFAQTVSTAVSAHDFLNSIGVCTHIGQGVDNATQSAAAMAYAGVRNLRDDGRSSHIQDWITVYQLSGVRTALLTDLNITSTVAMAKQLNAAGALLAVEGPNEPNNWPVTYQGQTSSSATSLPIARFQRDLYAAVKVEAGLKGIPVFHSSEAGGSEPDNCGLQFLSIPTGAGTLMTDGTIYADFANTHNYVCGHSGKLVDNVCWDATDPTLNGDWDGLWVEYGHTWWGAGFDGYSKSLLATLPRVSTETGWTTSGSGSISPEQQARIFLNLYLSGFKRGWKYTFIYMLRDDPSQGYWGLFDKNYIAKTSGTYLHNLTVILADSIPIASPGQLNYSIPNWPTTVHDLLMQKGDGTFELAVWNERPSGGSDSVAVELGAVFPAVKVYDPTAGIMPVRILANASSVELILSDHPNVVEIPPASAPSVPFMHAGDCRGLSFVLTDGKHVAAAPVFALPARAARVSLTVLDILGRELYCSGEREMAASGNSTVFWNGRCSGGRSIGHGVYLVKCAANGVVLVQKVLIEK